VVDRVVQQFGERVLHQLPHVLRQLEVRREIARPRQVFVQARERVALHDLAQPAWRVAGLAAFALALQPTQLDQLLDQATGFADAAAGALGHRFREVGGVLFGDAGDPGGDLSEFDAGHAAYPVIS
jgi:hypothetical protein